MGRLVTCVVMRSPRADDPLEVQLAGKLCRMIKAGKLKYLNSWRP
jgi:hypothetical protein